MKCGKCSVNAATVHVTEVINGVKKEAHLCDECARSAGVGIKFTFSISDILGTVAEPKPGKGTERIGPVKCPECGLSYSEFRQKARLGCPHDFEIFKAGLVPLLEKIHQSSQHVGKTPHNADQQTRKENELVKLKRELDTLVKSENFERAAEVRDRIRTLELELDKSPE